MSDGQILDNTDRYRMKEYLNQSQGQLREARQQMYKPPFMLSISKPNNGFSVIREDGQQYVFTDPNRLLAYIREAIGLPMNEVSAADSGILLEEEDK